MLSSREVEQEFIQNAVEETEKKEVKHRLVSTPLRQFDEFTFGNFMFIVYEDKALLFYDDHPISVDAEELVDLWTACISKSAEAKHSQNIFSKIYSKIKGE